MQFKTSKIFTFTPLFHTQMQGYSTTPIIIGSEANLIPESERALPELSHKWKCYVKAPPGLVKAVQFKLHESFTVSVINAVQPPFEVVEHGWGEFTIQVKITLFNEDKVSTSHYLKLHDPKYPLISERVDTVVYKGDQIETPSNFKYSYPNDDDEYNRIDKAISYVLELLDS